MLPERSTIFESDNYEVSFYGRCPYQAVVVFISAGGHIIASALT